MEELNKIKEQEKKVNDLLYKGLNAYKLYEKTDKKFAIMILRTASLTAQLMLKTAGIKYVYFSCPKCNRKVTNPVDQEFVKRAGECLVCDHIRSDYE